MSNERKLNIHPGKWTTRLKYDIYAGGYFVGTTRGTKGEGNHFDEAHAELIADAGNVALECDMLPSELLAAHAKDAALIQGLVDLGFHDTSCSLYVCRKCDCMYGIALERAKAAGYTPTPESK